MRIMIKLMVFSIGLFVCCGTASASMDVVRSYLKDKTKHTGTLDIYDEKIDSVRNLRTLKFPKDAKIENGKEIYTINYRDINSGDVVLVDIIVAVGAVESTKIKEIKSIAETDPAKDYNEGDIQKYMNDQISAQAKFTGFVSLYDEDKSKLRKLKLKELSTVVRKMGSLNISRATFVDQETNEILGVDITVKNKDGKLSLERLRIREVKKPQ